MVGVKVLLLLLWKTRAVTGKMKYASCLPVKNRLDKWRLLSQDRQTERQACKLKLLRGRVEWKMEEGHRNESDDDWPHLY